MSELSVQKKKGRATNSPYRSYLLQRNGILYFRVAVPNHLQSLLKRREIRKSLNTAKLREARPLALRLAVLAREYFLLTEKVLSGVVQMDTSTLLQFTDFTQENSHSVGTFLTKTQEDGFWDDLFLDHVNADKKTDRTASQAVLSEPVYTDKKSVTKTSVKRVIVDTEKNIVSDNQNFSLANHSVASVPTILKAVDAFIKAKSLVWTPGSAKDIPPHVKQFSSIMKEIAGRDMHITELSREHIRAYFEILKYLPHRVNTKELKNKKWKQLAEMGKKEQVERLLSSKTLQSRQINVRSFVNWNTRELFRHVISTVAFRKLLLTGRL